MSEIFDISRFDSYREDNRREVKKRTMVFLFLFGIHTRLLPTATAALSFSVSKKIQMAAGARPD